MANAILLANVRAYYANASTARAAKLGDEPRYGVKIAVKHDTAAENTISAAMRAVAIEKWAAQGVPTLTALTAQQRTAYAKQGAAINAGKAVEPYLEGCGVFGASRKESKGRPKLYDRYGQSVEALEIPHGSLCNVWVSLWAQDNRDPQIGKRINADLVGIQLLKLPDIAWEIGGGEASIAMSEIYRAPADEVEI